MTATTATLHPFERANLGLSPFRCVGMTRKVGPLNMGNGITVGAPGQAMGTCAYCGTGIADCFQIASADGKTFEVGSDCVARTYREIDSPLPLSVRRELSNVAKAKREVARVKKATKLRERVVAVRAILAADPFLLTGEPHPSDYYAAQGKTYRDYVEFLLTSGGMSGRRTACIAVESRSLTPGVTEP